MDVHHHSHLASGETHTPRKKWTHYFWDFLMLFFAVTLGFFVENQREHFIEHKREKELAKSLYEDIKVDTAQLNKIILTRKTRAAQLDSLFTELDQPIENADKALIFDLTDKSIIITYAYFSRASGTISQLKNSGYLRYFNGTPVPAVLSLYDSEIEALKEFEQLEFNEITDRYVPHVWQHFEAGYLNKSWYEEKLLSLAAGVSREPTIIGMNPEKLNYLKSLVISLKLINFGIKDQLIPNTLKQAASFLEALKKEYHLE